MKRIGSSKFWSTISVCSCCRMATDGCSCDHGHEHEPLKLWSGQVFELHESATHHESCTKKDRANGCGCGRGNYSATACEGCGDPSCGERWSLDAYRRPTLHAPVSVRPPVSDYSVEALIAESVAAGYQPVRTAVATQLAACLHSAVRCGRFEATAGYKQHVLPWKILNRIACWYDGGFDFDREYAIEYLDILRRRAAGPDMRHVARYVPMIKALRLWLRLMTDDAQDS